MRKSSVRHDCATSYPLRGVHVENRHAENRDDASGLTAREERGRDD
jgi:hypothetical protein